jgi:predicted nucleotidyltransferase
VLNGCSFSTFYFVNEYLNHQIALVKQSIFAYKVAEILKIDDSVIGLAVAGSWLTNELDEFSDLDLILVTKNKISDNKNSMLEYASRFGQLLNGFTGEHVGEPRVLICLYDNPLLHVDIKFLTLDEFKQRIENPVILLDTDQQLQKMMEQSDPVFPYPDYQWLEDRFWIWIHYALLKIGRGELLEAFDFLGFLRMAVLGPLLHIQNSRLPRGVRKAETLFAKDDFEKIMGTIPEYTRDSLLNSLEKSALLYKELRANLYSSEIELHLNTENSVLQYFQEIREKTS